MANPTKQDFVDWLSKRDPNWVVSQTGWDDSDTNLQNVLKDFLSDHFDTQGVEGADEATFTGSKFRTRGANVYTVPTRWHTLFVNAINAELPPLRASRCIELANQWL